MNKEKAKVKIKKKGTLTPITISIVSLSVFIMMVSIGIAPELMGDSVTKSSKYTVMYDSNGGGGSMPKQRIQSGKVAKLKGNRFKLDGYSFNGWRAKRSDNKWLCYIDENKVYNEWTDQSYCNKYGYSLFADTAWSLNLIFNLKFVT